jgi:para-aminobenzoate synthetase component 1
MQWVHESDARCSPEALAEHLGSERGLVLLASTLPSGAQGRYSFVTARPFLKFSARGTRCELWGDGQVQVQFGNPWTILETLIARYELLDRLDLPFPLGGCFGYFCYGLKNSTEPHLRQRAADDLELPDCQVGFYGSLVAFDHELKKTWVIATGLDLDGTPTERIARGQLEFWQDQLQSAEARQLGPMAPSPI